MAEREREIFGGMMLRVFLSAGVLIFTVSALGLGEAPETNSHDPKATTNQEEVDLSSSRRVRKQNKTKPRFSYDEILACVQGAKLGETGGLGNRVFPGVDKAGLWLLGADGLLSVSAESYAPRSETAPKGSRVRWDRESEDHLLKFIRKALEAEPKKSKKEKVKPQAKKIDKESVLYRNRAAQLANEAESLRAGGNQLKIKKAVAMKEFYETLAKYRVDRAASVARYEAAKQRQAKTAKILPACAKLVNKPDSGKKKKTVARNEKKQDEKVEAPLLANILASQ